MKRHADVRVGDMKGYVENAEQQYLAMVNYNFTELSKSLKQIEYQQREYTNEREQAQSRMKKGKLLSCYAMYTSAQDEIDQTNGKYTNFN
eukprot:TRINITY_DN11213_c0_g1_i1.p1 TRINITY_DN11213_c0_g1~~TRINITY_DN11213_c0_g1_i1.p1  ORF type:complete len:90 (+),score=21.83 TRINITY_DN11213_c0_g1_i1:175-444(+)